MMATRTTIVMNGLLRRRFPKVTGANGDHAVSGAPFPKREKAMKGLILTIALLTAAPAYARSHGAIINTQQSQQTFENLQRQQLLNLQQQQQQQQIEARQQQLYSYRQGSAASNIARQNQQTIENLQRQQQMNLQQQRQTEARQQVLQQTEEPNAAAANINALTR